MAWKFSKKIWLFLLAGFSVGMGQAFLSLFLNFYLKSMGLDDTLQGVINAIPALVAALASIPAILWARRFGEILGLKLGYGLSVVGILILSLANGAPLAILGSFIMGLGMAVQAVSTGPFMASETSEENRVNLFALQMALMTGAGFLGNILGGQVPAIVAAMTGQPQDSLKVIRAAVVVASILQLLGTLPILFLKRKTAPTLGQEGMPQDFSVADKGLMARLITPNILVGMGAGATIPYLNLFIQAKFNVSYEQLGSLFGWTSLATAATVLIQPALVKRFGEMKTIIGVMALSLPFMIIMGYVNFFPLVILSMFTRGALMNASGPVYNAFAMSLLPKEDRPVYSALTMMGWNLGWSFAAAMSGTLRAYFGPAKILFSFNLLFAWTLLMYALYLFATYWWLFSKRASAKLKTQRH